MLTHIDVCSFRRLFTVALETTSCSERQGSEYATRISPSWLSSTKLASHSTSHARAARARSSLFWEIRRSTRPNARLFFTSMAGLDAIFHAQVQHVNLRPCSQNPQESVMGAFSSCTYPELYKLNFVLRNIGQLHVSDGDDIPAWFF